MQCGQSCQPTTQPNRPKWREFDPQETFAKASELARRENAQPHWPERQFDHLIWRASQLTDIPTSKQSRPETGRPDSGGYNSPTN